MNDELKFDGSDMTDFCIVLDQRKRALYLDQRGKTLRVSPGRVTVFRGRGAANLAISKHCRKTGQDKSRFFTKSVCV